MLAPLRKIHSFIYSLQTWCSRWMTEWLLLIKLCSWRGVTSCSACSAITSGNHLPKSYVLHSIYFLLGCDSRYYLGHSQLIPGMADFSQGVFQQSVGRVKKKKKSQWLQMYPKIIIEMHHKTLLLWFQSKEITFSTPC